MADIVQQEPAKPFTLIVGHDEKGQSTATVRVRWSLSPETAQLLVEQKAQDLYVLLVVVNRGQERQRYVVPLSQEMMYISFRSPGNNTVLGSVVWREPHSADPRSMLTRPGDTRGTYDINVIEETHVGLRDLMALKMRLEDELFLPDVVESRATFLKGAISDVKRQIARAYNAPECWSIRSSFSSVMVLNSEDRVEVNVPPEMFAPEPPKWMSWLAGIFNWRTKSVDQCELRRRALITAALLPFWAVAKLSMWIFFAISWVTAKLMMVGAIVVLNIWGARSINYDPLISIYDMDVKDIWRYKRPSRWWWREMKGRYGSQRYEVRSLAYFVLSPPAVLLIAAIFVAFWFVGWPLVDLMVSGALVLGFAILLTVSWGVGRRVLGGRASSAQRHEQARDRKLERAARSIQSVASADPSALRPDISAIAPAHRTIHLRFLDLKAKVCRPFAQ